MSYTVNHGEFPRSCLPREVYYAELVDITAIGDSWRKYLEPSTGKIHDGAVYYAQMLSSN